MVDVRPVFDWLVAGAPGASSPAGVVERLGVDLRAAGVPVDRIEAFVRTLHPHIVGRSFLWQPGQFVEVRENSWAYLNSPAFTASPAALVFRTGEYVRHRLDGPAPARDLAALADLVRDGFTDFVAAPLTFISDQTHAITFATRDPEGFSADHVAAIRTIMPPLSRIAEILALLRTATNLLDTYVGRNAGERILAGRILRGDTETIRATIWLSDLRGFTSIAGSLEPGAVIRVLNDLFDCQVPAIERHGGEVLKFMGDGLLAIFPIEASGAAMARLCDAALDAATDAFAGLERLNVIRRGRGEAPIRFGLALHVGDVAYGNIGGSGRLDFTCIGAAVNVAARLEGLTERLGQPIVLSDAFAQLTSRPVEPLGSFTLKGVAEAQRAWAPVDRRSADHER